MRSNGIIAVLVLALVVILTSAPVWASDKVQAEVKETAPAAVVTPNGMAVGTTHVVYTVTAFELTPGSPVGSFKVDLSILDLPGNPETSYGLTLKLSQKQEGAGNLILTPDDEAFSVLDATWDNGDGTTVTVTIPDTPPSDDGATLTGTLQLEAEGPLNDRGRPTNPQLNTNTSIVVKVVLLHPTACLKAANFVTDNEFNALDTVLVNLKTDKKTGVTTVNSTNPGQFSDNVLVVNSCGEDQQIDLKINLDSCFDTNPAGNPGQAVFTYLAAGVVDEASFDISAFGAKTAQGQSLCLSGLTVPAGQTLLATVHMGAVKDILASALPADTTFAFAANIFEAGSESCTSGILQSFSDINPATASVPFAIK